ncbi:hypothetical protein ACPRNU_00220 [Chromobacterium vaccinii]|uniref:hypothetical protein n=1 Tax=Chromobacterium vaccinii TaxID=1108595 RepID=UPI003C710D0A
MLRLSNFEQSVVPVKECKQTWPCDGATDFAKVEGIEKTLTLGLLSGAASAWARMVLFVIFLGWSYLYPLGRLRVSGCGCEDLPLVAQIGSRLLLPRFLPGLMYVA